MSRKLLLIAGFCLLMLSSCFKKENPVPRKDRGSVITGALELGSEYTKEIYYSLLTKKDVKTIGKFDWDIGVSGDLSNPYIVLNTSKSMYAYKTDKKSLAEIRDTVGKLGKPLNDYPCGSPDSLALSGILSNEFVYIIDLGYDASFQKADFILLKASIINNTYLVEYSKIDGSGYKSKNIAFDQSSNLLFYNFESEQVIPEAKTQEWDILFTQYQHVYYDPFQTYSVVGCLINQSTMMACEYKGTRSFRDIQAKDTTGSPFSSRKDIIGFGWKYYNLTNNQYIINPNKVYFLKRSTGNIYKLHFIDFYSSTGVKGTPTFEFQEI
jgi:hypothetical protein